VLLLLKLQCLIGHSESQSFLWIQHSGRCWCLIDMEGPSRRDVITMDSTTLIRQSIGCKLLSMITGEESTMHLRTSMKRYPIASPMKYKADSWNARWLVPWSYQEATCANLRRRTTITWLPITAGSISLSGSMHSGQSSHYYHLWTPDQRIPVARDGCAREPGSSVNSDPATMEFARGWTLHDEMLLNHEGYASHKSPCVLTDSS
jgi:hypothetical protein